MGSKGFMLREPSGDCYSGEPQVGERRYTEISAGPRAKQEGAATR